MTYTLLGDEFTDSPRMLQLTRSARLLHVEALIWCNKHLTDGAMPTAALKRICDSDDPDQDAADLVRVGTWEETATGWQLDWTGQETSERVLERRAYNADKQASYRRRGQLHARGDHSECTSQCPQKKRVTGNATSNETGNVTGLVTGLVTAPIPSPSRPLGREEVKGYQQAPDGARSAGATRSQSEPAGVPHIGPPPGTVIVPVIDWGEND